MTIKTLVRRRSAGKTWRSVFLLAPLLISLNADAQDVSKKIESYVEAFHEYRLFNGSVLVAQKGEVIFEGGFGHANMSWDVPNSPQTKHRIASTTKQFTAALVLSLVETGELNLNGKVAEYLPWYPTAQGERVSIHHLLSHTSGIANYTSLPGFMTDDVRDPFEPDSMIALFSDLDLEFEPGSQWAYSNSGYILLGAIVEAVTGRSYQDVLRERVLDPVGLDDTGYDSYNDVIERRAAGYVSTPKGYDRAPYLDTSVPYSAGMLYSTVRDLYKWDQALYDRGPFLSERTKEEYFSPRIPLPAGMAEQFGLPPHYAYGWFVGNVAIGNDTLQIVEHGGSIFGFATGFWRVPDERMTIILLDNSSSGSVREMGRGLMSILHGYAASNPKRPISHVLFEAVESDGIAAAKAQYFSISEQDPGTYDLSESELNTLGYHYLGKGDVAKAIEIFALNVDVFPKSANAFDSLGEAYMKAGKRSKAIESYRKSLELNPNASSARRALRSLGEKVD